MRKPSFKHFHTFKKKYDAANEKAGLKQPLVPYFISSHPGCELQDMANLAIETKDMGFQLEQVQDFTPTPMTVATEIYYTGVHPYTLQPIYTVKDPQEKKDQNKFFFWYKSENHQWIKDKLNTAKHPHLIKQLLSFAPKRDTFKDAIMEKQFVKKEFPRPFERMYGKQAPSKKKK